MGLLSNVKTNQTVTTEDIIRKEGAVPDKPLKKTFKRPIACDNLTSNAVQALVLLGKFENAKDFILKSLNEYVNNNLTDQERTQYEYVREMLDMKDMNKK